jgi:hypothetical protein
MCVSALIDEQLQGPTGHSETVLLTIESAGLINGRFKDKESSRDFSSPNDLSDDQPELDSPEAQLYHADAAAQESNKPVHPRPDLVDDARPRKRTRFEAPGRENPSFFQEE